jgi:hypothetical protein
MPFSSQRQLVSAQRERRQRDHGIVNGHLFDLVRHEQFLPWLMHGLSAYPIDFLRARFRAARCPGIQESPLKQEPPADCAEGGCWGGSLTMTYFHARAGHYHRRWHVSRSCSGWEGVVPRRYGRQT